MIFPIGSWVRPTLTRGVMRPSTLSSHRARISEVATYLAAHLDDLLDAGLLARRAGLSSRPLARVFTRMIGESPRAHLRRLRLERAAVELRTTRATILTVALEAGFESHEAFPRVFRVRFGHTPQAYRRLAQVTVQPRSRTQLWQRIGAGGLRRYTEQRSLKAEV